MADVKLITEVRNYSVLYDQNDNKYNDTQHKDQIWDSIGKKIHQSGSQCKKRWNNVRDNFRKSLKKHQKKKAEGKKATKYKYEEQLQFLIPFFKEETLHCATLPNFTEEEVAEQHMRTVKNEQPAEDSDSSVQSAASSSSMESSPIVSPKIIPIKAKALIKNTNQNAASTLMNFLLAKEKKDTKAVDAIDCFLAGIGATLKTFPDYQLNVAKSKIFSIVQEIEMKLIMEQYSPNAPFRNHSTQKEPGTSNAYDPYQNLPN